MWFRQVWGWGNSLDLVLCPWAELQSSRSLSSLESWELVGAVSGGILEEKRKRKVPFRLILVWFFTWKHFKKLKETSNWNYVLSWKDRKVCYWRLWLLFLFFYKQIAEMCRHVLMLKLHLLLLERVFGCLVLFSLALYWRENILDANVWSRRESVSLPPNASFRYKVPPAPESWVNLPFFQGSIQTVQLIRDVQTHPPQHTLVLINW